MHLYAYLGVALAFSHQLATGTDFLARPAARAYWTALYVVTLGALVIFRILLPPARSLLLHRLRVERVVEEAPGVVSLEIGGERLHRLRAQAGQFFTWRFLTRDRWWEAHPFSLSAAPDGRRLRITVKGIGDYTASLRAIPPGTRVIAEGPFGSFTAAARRRPRVALIAGGVGITPIRALLESMPGGPEDITVVYRAVHDDDVILRSELDELAGRRGVEVHYVLGGHDAAEPLSPERLCALMPDIATRDVYVCGPPAMVEATRATLGPLGRLAPPHRHGTVRVLKAARRTVVTAAVVVLLARFETEAPRTFNPNSGLGPGPDAACAREAGRHAAADALRRGHAQLRRARR